MESGQAIRSKCGSCAVSKTQISDPPKLACAVRYVLEVLVLSCASLETRNPVSGDATSSRLMELSH